jgi:hypothetical protein
MIKRSCFAAISAVLLLFVTSVTFGQRPRVVPDDPNQSSTTTPPPAPESVKAKYEGGVFGYPHKKTGTLDIDISNSRLTFRDGKRKELFSIPFPAAATVISQVPLYGIPASFIRTKVRYLTVQYDDPDSKVMGITSFRLDNKPILDSVLYTVATKAGLTKRGDIYVRKKE